MAKKASCKCKKVECEECPEWIFTFADLVMLMMGFFVILWVLKPAGKPGEASAAGKEGAQRALPVEVLAPIREAFGYVPDAKSADPVDQYLIQEKLEHMRRPKGPGVKGESHKEPKGAEGTDEDVTTIRPGKQYTSGGFLGFEKGEAKLSAELTASLDQIVKQIKGHRNIVMVKGHASLDDLSETATSAQRMKLSVDRAEAVANYLTAHGVDPEILRVQGCSTSEPVVQREYGIDAQARNRRVEIESTGMLVDERQNGAGGKVAE